MECVKEKPKQKKKRNKEVSNDATRKEEDVKQSLDMETNQEKLLVTEKETKRDSFKDESEIVSVLSENNEDDLKEQETFKDEIPVDDKETNVIVNNDYTKIKSRENTDEKVVKCLETNKEIILQHDIKISKTVESSKQFQKIMETNKQILNTCNEEDLKIIIRPYTESQLVSLYVNEELERVDQFNRDFILAELGGNLKKHKLYELLDNYLLVRNKMINNLSEYDDRRKNYKEAQKDLWILKSSTCSKTVKCLDGNDVIASHNYTESIFQRSRFQDLSMILNHIRKLLGENHLFYSYSAQVLKLQIDNYLQPFINEAKPTKIEAVSLKTEEKSSSDLIETLNELRRCISVLFSFQRRLVKDTVFIEESRKWLSNVIAVLLLHANWQDHLFMLNHVLRCPAGVGEWASSFIQSPLDLDKEESPFFCNQINHLVCMLSAILTPIDKRLEFLEQFSQRDDSVGENLWIFVDSDGEEDENSVLPSLKENDLVQITNQLPLDNLFRRMLNIKIKPDGTDFYDVNSITENQVLRFFAFGTVLIKILKRGLETYNSQRYNQFNKRLCRLIRHIVQFATDQWEILKKSTNLNDSSMMKRLQVEYDAFFLRATNYLYCSQKLGAWQFLAVVPYHMISSNTLWTIFGLLHTSNDFEIEKKIINNSDEELTNLKRNLWNESLRLEYEEKLSKMLDAESYYLLNTFANMALARGEQDIDFVHAAVLDLIEVGFISENTRETCSKNARILLTYVTSKHPHLLSNILRKTIENIEKMTSMSIYLYEQLPLSIWFPTDEDLELLSTCILHKNYSSDECRLSRMIISRLNWQYDKEKEKLCLPHEIHVKIALLMAECVDKDENEWLTYAWKIIYKLRLHYNDCGFKSFDRIPSPDNFDIIYRGLRQKKPFHSLLALLITTWGHLIPLICTKGLELMETLINNNEFYATLHSLNFVVPLFIDCQESLINMERYQNVLGKLLSADRSYLNMAKNMMAPNNPILNQFGNMIQKHVNKYENRKHLIRLWINSLVSIPGWNKDYGVLYLLDVIIKASLFHSEAISVVRTTLKDLLQVSTPQEQSKTIFTKWISLSNQPQGSLLMSDSIPHCPYLAYVLIKIEYEEREETTGLWKEILLQLHQQKGKVNVDAAIKKAASVKKVSNFTSSSLCLFRWSQQALSINIDHPMLPLLWQNFFTLYLTRVYVTGSPDSVVCVGEKFFDGIVNFNYLKRIKRHLQETVDYYKQQLNSIERDEETNTKYLFYENCFRIFKAYSLWLEEPRLQESNLYLSGLPPQYLPQYLSLILDNNAMPWMELVNYERIKTEQTESINYWKNNFYRQKSNYNKPTNLSSRLECEDPVERIIKRLNSFDVPKNPPQLILNPVNLFQPIYMEEKKKMFDLLEPYFVIIRSHSHNYTMKISEHKAIDSYYKDLIPQLYRNYLIQVVKKVNCKGSGNQACTGGASITLQMNQTKLEERVERLIETNRKEYEHLLAQYLQEPSKDLCNASGIIQTSVEKLLNQNNNILGIELFYYFISLINEETNAFMPGRHLLTTCLDKLGRGFILGIDYETPRLLDKILEENSLTNVLTPYFSTVNSSTSNFIHMYSTIVDNLINKFDVISNLLPKFDLMHFLNKKKPKISERNKLIRLILQGLTKLGFEPLKNHLELYELLRNHLILIFEFQFPEHYGDVLTLLLQFSNPIAVAADSKETNQTVSIAVWSDVIKSLARKNLSCNGDDLREYAQTQQILTYRDYSETCSLLTAHFSNERLRHGLYGLYSKYRQYVDVFSTFFGMITHGLIVGAMRSHGGLLGDDLCDMLWPQLRDVLAPWIAPYWLENVKNSMPNWMQQLTDDRAVLLPWIPADVSSARKMIGLFIESVQFVVRTLPACNSIFGSIWHWYATNYAHAAVKEHVLEPLHSSLTQLPWNRYFPSSNQLELMSKVVDQYLPQSHTFVGHVFVQINWQNWIGVLVPNSPIQISMQVHRFLLNLLVKLSNDPQVRNNCSDRLKSLLVQAETFNWTYADPQTIEQLMDWYVMSCVNPMVLFVNDPNDIDCRILNLLKTASQFHKIVSLNEYDSLTKRHLFVRGFVKMLSIFMNRNKKKIDKLRIKSLISSQLNHLDLVVKFSKELEVLLKEYFSLFAIVDLNQVLVECFEDWIGNKTSDNFLFEVLLNNLAFSIKDSVIVARLYEHCIDCYFNNNVNNLAVISWTRVAIYLKPFPPKQTELENVLIQEGKILTLNALIYQKINNSRENDLLPLLNILINYLIQIKVTTYTEDKIILIWFQILFLCEKLSHKDESSVVAVLQKFSQILSQQNVDKGVAGWGKGLLGAIGLTKNDSASIKFKFLSKAVSAYVLAQLPDVKGQNEQIVRKIPGAPCTIGHPGCNKECGKLLLNLDMGLSQGEIKTATEVALKQIQDPCNSLHNSIDFLTNLVTRLYTKSYLTYQLPTVTF